MSTYREQPAQMPETLTRVYTGFRGVDFTSDPTQVVPQRSPYALNVYRDYASSEGQAIETFPGFRKVADFGDEIYGIHAISRAGDPAKIRDRDETVTFQPSPDADVDYGKIYYAEDYSCIFYFEMVRDPEDYTDRYHFRVFRLEQGFYQEVDTPIVLLEDKGYRCVKVKTIENETFLYVLYEDDIYHLQIIGVRNGYEIGRHTVDLPQLPVPGDDRAGVEGMAVMHDGEHVIIGAGADAVCVHNGATVETLPELGRIWGDLMAVGPDTVAATLDGQIGFYGWDGYEWRTDMLDRISLREVLAMCADQRGRWLVLFTKDGNERLRCYEKTEQGYALYAESGWLFDMGALNPYEMVWMEGSNCFVTIGKDMMEGKIQQFACKRGKIEAVDLDIGTFEDIYAITSLRYGVSVDGNCYVAAADLTQALDSWKVHFYEQEQVHMVRYLVHAGEKLYQWRDFLSGSKHIQYDVEMNPARSRCIAMGNEYGHEDVYHYILDGKNYLRYKWDEDRVVHVREDNPFIPTTYTGVTAGEIGGGGVALQPVNAFTPRRKNVFVCKSGEKKYKVIASDPAVPLDSSPVKAWFRDMTWTEGSQFTVDRAKHIITFTVAPDPPPEGLPGLAELTIEFGQTTASQAPVIERCTMCAMYDGRLFFSGNPNAPNQFYHTQRADASYLPISAYYNVGTASSKIVGMMMVGGELALLKSADGQDSTVYTCAEMETGEELHPVGYPAKPMLGGVGCIAPFGYLDFLDDPVFVSRYGVEGIGKPSIYRERGIEHRSTMVDAKLVNEPGLQDAYLVEWRGYLCVLVNGHIYLADSRQRMMGQTEEMLEYEWYYLDTVGNWDDNGEWWPARILMSQGGELYFGCENGTVCKYNHDMTTGEDNGALISRAYNNDGRPIFSCWVLPYDDLGLPNRFKRTNKRGAKVDLKTMSHGAVKIKTKTERTPYKYNTGQNTGVLDFGDMDFVDFSFETSDVTSVYFKPREKKFERFTTMFYSDVLNRPFGLLMVVFEAFVGGYSKPKR